jgi:hypothetical protein
MSLPVISEAKKVSLKLSTNISLPMQQLASKALYHVNTISALATAFQMHICSCIQWN